jgi:hypothetical protein
MGFQCAVLGHTYDGTESEERREDRDDGTVLISREYQTCTRCGTRKELYRNEQLLPNQAKDGADESPTADSAPAGDRADSGQSRDVDGTLTGGTADSEPRDSQTAVETGATPTETPAGPAATTTESATEPPVTADEEAGGVILEADGGESDPRAGPEDRSFGEWPQDATRSENEESASDTDDGVVLSGSSRSTSRAGTDDSAQQSARTETAEAWATSGDSAETEPTSADQSLRGAEETVAELSAFGTDETTDPDIRCPDCEAGWARAETSLRDGDLCPDCRAGYVEVR